MFLKITFLLPFFLSSCFTPNKERQISEDIFAVQTRLLALESNFNDANKTGTQATQRIASTGTELERLSQELKKVQGDLDVLKIGVQTGHLPGTPENTDSPGSKMDALSKRMDGMETRLDEFLQAFEKSGIMKKNDKKGAEKSSGTLKELQTAFDHKKYPSVIADAPKVIKSVKGVEKEHASYLQAESLYKAGRMKEAAMTYDEFLKSKPHKKYLPYAKLRLGDSFKGMGDKDVAKIYYQELIKDFPESPEAKKAKGQLSLLNQVPSEKREEKGAENSPSQKDDKKPQTHHSVVRTNLTFAC